MDPLTNNPASTPSWVSSMASQAMTAMQGFGTELLAKIKQVGAPIWEFAKNNPILVGGSALFLGGVIIVSSAFSTPFIFTVGIVSAMALFAVAGFALGAKSLSEQQEQPKFIPPHPNPAEG